MKFALIVNPAAGGGRAGRTLAEVQRELSRLGLEHRVELTRGLEHARELARLASTAGEVAVAFGGDGLVGAVAGALRHDAGVLGVLPGGRGNDLARSLGISLQPRAACAVLAGGVMRLLDLGEVNSKTFIGVASCGLDSDANRIANRTRLVRGNLVYTYGALRALVAWRPASFTVQVDDRPKRTFAGYSVAAANSRSYAGGMLVAPGASLQDGMLDVVTVAQIPKLRLLAVLHTVFSGAHVEQANVDVRRGAQVRISASRPFTVYADGDPIAELPVTVRALPGAVRTLVPAS